LAERISLWLPGTLRRPNGSPDTLLCPIILVNNKLHPSVYML
jgi:hypothetical protein